MGLNLTGRVVETESKPWTMNGASGTSYNVYVAGGRARDGAIRVKVKPEQFGAFAEGQDVDLPVAVFARASDFGGAPRMEYTLDPEYKHAAALRSTPAPSRAAVG